MRSSASFDLERGLPSDGDVANDDVLRNHREASAALEGLRSQSRRDIITTEDIVVPAHLLGTVRENHEWSPAPADPRRTSARTRSGSQRDFDIVRIAYGQRLRQERRIERRNSVNIAALGRAARADAFAVPGAGLPRWPRTSLPNNSLGRMSPFQASAITALPPIIPRNSVGALGVLPSNAPTGVTDFASLDPFPEVLEESTTLFTRLSSYDLRGQARPQLTTTRSGDSDIDPFSGNSVRDDTVHPGEFSEKHATGRLSRAGTPSSHGRRQSVVSLAAGAVINVVHAATNGVTNLVRRNSLHDVYEKAKVRSLYLQRKRWVQIFFEWAVYVLLLAFVYFVLVGLPLWNGAVWWLYWVVGHKFVVAGTWSVTIGLALL
ncbi:hypothetical protein B0A48_16791 [Cryoendolithus antarcticus]|uniref:Uncharacterized protein n=1 Tax=Cryoendolithus antarcticus TaxID=1507870 RepID=A0A1V8SDW9_9PEZI|nr:hypothetical protein B0A48_16791 [Cryoendolithus antarcticus]